jgi:hypothetical protein
MLLLQPSKPLNPPKQCFQKQGQSCSEVSSLNFFDLADLSRRPLLHRTSVANKA